MPELGRNGRLEMAEPCHGILSAEACLDALQVWRTSPEYDKV